MIESLPLYQCHKKVRAAKIEGFRVINQLGQIELNLGIFGVKCVESDWPGVRNLDIGGYFVQYDDGYTSYSPGKAFEDGYTLL